MFFQFEVSPNKPVKKTQSVAPLEEVAVLKLAPFSPNPKIFFENVAVGEVETKKLIIQNPNPYKSKVIITKFPPADRFVALSWKETEIEAQEETFLELTWTPKEEGGWRDLLCIRDNQNVNRNIAIVFKSIPKKGKRRTVNKQAAKPKPTVVAVPPVKKFRSPKNTKKKRSPMKQPEKVCMPKSYKCENCDNNIHITTCSPRKKRTNIMESNKENSPIIYQNSANLSPIIFEQNSENVSYSKLTLSEKLNRMNNSSFFKSPSSVSFKCDNILQTPIRRETYVVKSPDIFNDSLELEKKLEHLELTPELLVKSHKSNDSFIKKLDVDATPEMSIKRKLDNIELTPEVSKSQTSSMCDTFIKKLNMDSPEISVSNNRSRTSDHFLVQKYLSDSLAYSTAIVSKKTPNIKLHLNDIDIIDDSFNPNNCSTDIKKHNIVNKNNSSTPKELFKLNSTYELTPANNKNLSPNLSGETYTVSNISSSSTYAILSPDDTHSRIREIVDEKQSSTYARISTSSPLLAHTSDQFHATSNYLNFSGINAKTALSCIIEEDRSSSDISFKNSSIRSDFSNNGMKRKSDQPETVFNVSPPKRAFLKPKSPKPVKNINTSWNKKVEKTEKIRRKSISTLRLNLSKVSTKSNNSSVSDISTSSVNITQTSCHIDPFLIAAMYNSDTSTVNLNLDPFISSTLYYDEKWLDKQMQELKKWLNAILTPPSELAATAESKKVDVAKLWQECVRKDLIYAPTKEKVSSKYHTNHKLEILRKSAKNLFQSLEMRNALSKVAVTIENKQMTIRDDKNLHLDVGLQSHILTLLLCYNPLWLRIGLETIYNEPIPLDSNSDIIGLSTFIMLRFFRCPDLMPKNKQQATHIKYLPTYGAAIKKFTLRKFLMLIYFLDQAKTKKLISHDPCLFCKDAPVKESKELLLSFARELLSAVGDITKFLRRLGYEVSHKQSYIDEFDYAVKNLGVDLRDGIRLTKVMEIILMRNDLTNQLRGPAISRLQKIHNVKLALDSLIQAGYTIAGEITSKDIVDGHREKTLSLLWQIIYKFQAPRFTAAAIKIQTWWQSLRIVVQRRILDRPRQLRINAAITIQKFYRSYKLMQKERTEFLRVKQSAVTIQKYTRSMFLMKRDRLQYLLKKQAVIIIQQRYRASKLMTKDRHDYLEKKNAAIIIQRHFRAKLTMIETRQSYEKLKNVVIKIQRNFRSKQIVKEHRNNFLEKRNAALTLQRNFRATQQMKHDRNTYLRTRNIVVKLQQRFRATILMREERHTYLEQRKSIILLQEKYRATILMKQVQKSYLEQRQAVIIIQQRFRAYLTMKQARGNYLQQRKSVIIIQKSFRAYLDMKKCHENYLNLKQATIILQQRFRATILMKTVRENYQKQKDAAVKIQHKFRAYLEMKKCRENYLKLKQATVFLQQSYRATMLMKTVRENYLKQRDATIYIQQKFRAQLEMKKNRTNYLDLKKATIIVQERFRANQVMKQVRHNYLEQRQAAVTIQERFRANLIMKNCRNNYLELKQATVIIQRRFRANMLMKTVREDYLKQRESAIKIQQTVRAYMEMKKCRENYLALQQATIFVQQRFRATMLMKTVHEDYMKQKDATIKIQQKFRAYLEMKKCRENYLILKQNTIFIQQKFRATMLMQTVRENYVKQKDAAVKIQQKLRAHLEMKKCRENYLVLKQTTIFVQQKFRATLLMKTVREDYLARRNAAVKIQNKLKAYLEMKKCRENYVLLIQSTIFVQQRFRAIMLMRSVRQDYLKQRGAAITIQEKFRAHLEMKKCRENYLVLKQITLQLQQRFRANILMKAVRENYLKQRTATIYIQQHFRAQLEMKKYRTNYLDLKQATIIVQERFRANQVMKQVRQNYLQQRNAALKIQGRYRAYLAMKNCRDSYLKLKKASVVIQRRFRANMLMKTVREDYLKQREATVYIQQIFRAQVEMKKCRENYLKLKQATVLLQQSYRATMLMKTVRENYLKQRDATIYIQQKFRAQLEMKKYRTNYLHLKQSTIIVQERFRANQVMKQVRHNYLEQRQAALTIQQRFRANLIMKNCRNNYLELKQATVIIQRRFRANMLMKTVREDYLKQRESAIKIQHTFRANLEMKRYRSNYLEQRRAAITIQEKYRAYLSMKTCRNNYLKLKQYTIIVQQRFRAVLAMKAVRESYVQKRNAVILIQQKLKSYLEMRNCRENYLKLKKATTCVQNRFRANLAMKNDREKYLMQRKAATIIQKQFRFYLIMKKCRKEFIENKLAVIKIQRYYRAYISRCLVQKLELKIKAVIKIQSWVRMHAAKKQLAILRENAKDTEEKKEERRRNNAVVKIQALWRGYKTRKVMCKKMAIIRQRSEDAANNAVPELTIGQRNREAIDLLMYQTSMKEIIRALTILDFTTRLFPNLCIEVCDEIAERLYILLVCTNRSVPDMDASILCVSVLINLYKYQPTSAAVWKVQFVERLLSVLLHWSDKDSLLFPYVCTLIWLFAQKQEYCTVIKAESNVDKILKKTYQQCERRQKMLTRMRNAPITIPIKGKKDVLPSLTPDWGIINVNRPRVFRNPVFAIKCLLKKLNVTLSM